MDFYSIASCFSRLQGSAFVFLSLSSEELLLTGSAVNERFGSLTSKRDLYVCKGSCVLKQESVF